MPESLNVSTFSAEAPLNESIARMRSQVFDEADPRWAKSSESTNRFHKFLQIQRVGDIRRLADLSRTPSLSPSSYRASPYIPGADTSTIMHDSGPAIEQQIRQGDLQGPTVLRPAGVGDHGWAFRDAHSTARKYIAQVVDDAILFGTTGLEEFSAAQFREPAELAWSIVCWLTEMSNLHYKKDRFPFRGHFESLRKLPIRPADESSHLIFRSDLLEVLQLQAGPILGAVLFLALDEPLPSLDWHSRIVDDFLSSRPELADVPAAIVGNWLDELLIGASIKLSELSDLEKSRRPVLVKREDWFS